MERTCQYCKNILGCPHLGDEHGRFVAEKVITADNPRDCRGFAEIGDREKQGVRERLYGLSGLGYLRTLHELPNILMDGLRQGEKDELMYEEKPDFQNPKLLYEGMPVSEREEVLRYETDEEGQVIVETDSEGNEVKRARPSYHLKQYAIDEEGPIRLNHSVCWFWTTNQLVDYILKAELEAGILFKEKKSRAANDRATPKLPPATQERETKMTDGKRVRVTRGGGSKGAAKPAAGRVNPKRATPKPAAGNTSTGGGGGGGGRVARPARGKTAAAPQTEAEAPAGAPTGDLGDVKEMLAELKEMVTELKAENAELKAQITDLRETVIDTITIFHDIMAQTAGTLQYPAEDEEGNDVFDEDGNQVMNNGPELYPKASKIFAYLDGTAFEADEDEGGEGEE